VAKLIILSIIIISFAVPIRLAGAAHPRSALRKTQIIFLVYVAIWGYMCVRWYPALVELK
jgi:hypothetical protein